MSALRIIEYFMKTLRVIGIICIVIQIIIYMGSEPSEIVYTNLTSGEYEFRDIPKLEHFITTPLSTMLAGITNLDSKQFVHGLGHFIGVHTFIILGFILVYTSKLGKS